jgi:hypothetical protein
MYKGTNPTTIKITKLKAKQKTIEDSWGRAGNPKLIQFLIDIVPELLNAERCSIFIYNPSTDSLWLYRGTDMQEGEIQVPRKGSMAGEALSTGKHMIFTDMEDKAGVHESVDIVTKFTTSNTLSVPILNRTGDQVIGVLQVLNKKATKGFDDNDVKLMYRMIDLITKYVEHIYKHQEVAEILFKIKKKIKGLETFEAKKGIKRRLDAEQITAVHPQANSRQFSRLH